MHLDSVLVGAWDFERHTNPPMAGQSKAGAVRQQSQQVFSLSNRGRSE
jgi:hypothetical protein